MAITAQYVSRKLSTCMDDRLLQSLMASATINPFRDRLSGEPTRAVASMVSAKHPTIVTRSFISFKSKVINNSPFLVVLPDCAEKSNVSSTSSQY